MPGAEIRRSANAQRGRSGAFVAGQLAGVMSTAANAILNPIVVLPALVAGFTDSWYLIAVPAVLAGVLWLPGAGLAGLSASRERPGVWAIAGNVIRLLVVVALAFVLDRNEQYSDDAMLRALCVCYGIYVVGNAIASRSGALVAASTVPAGRRSRYFASRTVWGSLAAITVALVAAALFGNESLSFPAPFAILFVIAAACLGIGAWFQSTMPAPTSVASAVTAAGRTTDRAGRGLVTYVGFRWLLAASTLADPFLIVYALTDLEASPAVIGLYVALIVAGRLLSEPLWAGMARRGRIKAGLQAVAILRVLVPALALTLPQLSDSTVWTDRVSDPDARGWLFGTVFVVIGVAQGGQARLNLPYLDQVAARHGRSSRPATNAIVATAALAPMAGAWIYSRWGFDEMLLTAAGVGLLGVLVSGGLVATGGVARAVRGSWQLRRPGAAVSLSSRRD